MIRFKLNVDDAREGSGGMDSDQPEPSLMCARHPQAVDHASLSLQSIQPWRGQVAMSSRSAHSGA